MISSGALEALNEALSSEIAAKGVLLDQPTGDQFVTPVDALLERGDTERKIAIRALETVTRCRAINPNMISFTEKFLGNISVLFSKSYLLESLSFPIKHEGSELHMVMTNPLDDALITEFECLSGSTVIPYCGSASHIEKALVDLFPNSENPTFENADSEFAFIKAKASEYAAFHLNSSKNFSVLELVSNPYVIILFRLILSDVLEKSISDLHFETEKNDFRLRVRQDGVLREVWRFEKPLGQAITARLKILCDLPFDPALKPLDGRIAKNLVIGREMDIRVSILMGTYGEKSVLRILDRGKDQLSLDDLNIGSGSLSKIENAMLRPNGMILVTGPTGSGKTTTLYAILKELNKVEVNISTAEDPVEYELAGATQVNCTDTGTTFAEALKSFLRQDPDIIMVGEIRDQETADIATKAALTGHLMLSTLHTNDAASAITRLLNIGVSPYVLAACNITIVAQRLIRTICKSCKMQYEPSDVELKKVDINPEDKSEHRFFIGEGCQKCSGTGYRGRQSILEVLAMDAELEKLVAANAGSGEIQAVAVKNGMQTMRQSAQEKMLSGSTTIDEVLRVTANDE